VPPAPLSPGGQPLADFGNRLLAYLIDIAILSVATTIVAAPVGLVYAFAVMRPILDTANPDGSLPPEVFGRFFGWSLLLWVSLLVLILAGYYIYTVEMMWRSGQTVGKRVMKLRVVPLDPGARLTRGIAAKRWSIQYAAGSIVPFLHHLDGFWQLWDKPYQQTLHDKFAKTVVVRVSP
jgi:uncharacterized RDD family membrane protein YckC